MIDRTVPSLALVGGVASGKTEVSKQLTDILPEHCLVDTGVLFRIAASFILEHGLVSPNFNNCSTNQLESTGNSESFLGRTKQAVDMYEAVFAHVAVERSDRTQEFSYKGNILSDALYGQEIDAAVPYVAKNLNVRGSIVRWFNEYALDAGKLIITAHGMSDYDVSVYHTMCLKVDEHTAAARLRARNGSSYASDVHAREAVRARNREDGIDVLHMQVAQHRIPTIDTSELNVREVADKIIVDALSI